MAHHFGHEKLIVYQKAIYFVTWSSGLLKRCRGKAAAKDHFARAANSIPVRIAEGNAKRSVKARIHSIDIAYGSSLECAACLDVLTTKQLCSEPEAVSGKRDLSEVVAMLLGLRRSTHDADSEVAETPAPYGDRFFAHERLPVYRSALTMVAWLDGLLASSAAGAEIMDGLDKSATSVVLNIAEGNGRFSMGERCRFLEIAHTSALRCAATLDVLVARETLKEDEVEEGKAMLAEIVSQLIAWSDSLRSRDGKRS